VILISSGNYMKRSLAKATLTLAILLCPFISNLSRAEILRVPSGFPSIQSAVEIASDGDTVIVGDGSYYEGLSLMGKNLVISSMIIEDGDTSHVSATIVDTSPLPEDSGCVIKAIGDPGMIDTATVTGLTIRGGDAVQGGGVYVRRYAITLSRCRFEDNYANEGGIAYLASYAYVTFDSCEIQGDGASIETHMDLTFVGSCTIRDCNVGGAEMTLRTGLNISGSSFDSCAIEIWTYSISDLRNSIFENTTFYVRDESWLTIDSCTFSGGSIETQSSTLTIDWSVLDADVIVNDDIGSSMHASNASFLSGLNSEVSKEARMPGDYPFAGIDMQRCIIHSESGPAIKCLGDNTNLALTCCVVHSPDQYWLDGIPDGLDTSFVTFADPLLCEEDSASAMLAADSPCLPANNGCSLLIGARGQGCPARLTCGDIDSSGDVDVDDVILLFEYIFGYADPPNPVWKADPNCSDNTDIDDVVYLTAYIFSSGPPPCVECDDH
jgi:hypothetical protein